MLMRLLKRAGHLSKSKVTLAFRHGVTNGSTQTDKMIDLGETMGSQGHHGPHANLLQRQVYIHKFRDVGKLHHKVVARAQTEREEMERQAFSVPGHLLVRDLLSVRDHCSALSEADAVLIVHA